MAPPAWLRLYAATDDTRYLDFGVSNFWRTADFLYDKNEHLFFRDITFSRRTESNGRKIFWDVGNGWVFAATVRMLQYLPMNHPGRPRFEKLLQEMAEKILSVQQSDGMWRASLLDPADYPTREAGESTGGHSVGTDALGMLAITGPLAVMDAVSSRIMDSQFYPSPLDARETNYKLLFQVDLAPGETRTYYIFSTRALAAVPPPIANESTPVAHSRRFPTPRAPVLKVSGDINH
jgi:hypothetical protein